ncbi:MAG TPA: GNAT family N-acetyltransferase [Rhabdaerophilum sp.]|nr:GNAT family N-acetyltransferase [Rhabdaerophilum sp.]
MAAERHLHPHHAIEYLIVEDKTRNNTLCALFPLERPHLRDGILWGALALYRNPYLCLTAPPLRKDDADEILATALTVLARRAPRLILPMISTGRAFERMLHAVSERLGLALVRVDGRARAAVETELDVEVYRTTFWKKAIRSQERRRLRQLGEVGHVVHRVFLATDPGGQEALNAFLTLEKAGWKGRHGTAILQSPATAAFATEAFLPTREPGRVLFETLSVDDKVIAVNVNLVAGQVGFALKSAYDESFARFGAGNLLDGFSLALASAGGALQRLDSCAPPHHPIHHRWRQEERIDRLLLGLAPDVPLHAMARWMARLGPYGLWRGFDLPNDTA